MIRSWVFMSLRSPWAKIWTIQAYSYCPALHRQELLMTRTLETDVLHRKETANTNYMKTKLALGASLHLLCTKCSPPMLNAVGRHAVMQFLLSPALTRLAGTYFHRSEYQVLLAYVYTQVSSKGTKWWKIRKRLEIKLPACFLSYCVRFVPRLQLVQKCLQKKDCLVRIRHRLLTHLASAEFFWHFVPNTKLVNSWYIPM